MAERVFEWDDIDEETRMKDQQIRKQRRYRKGLENYNDYGNESFSGHYWRELANEPFSWYDKSFDSPYKTRSYLTRN